MKPLLLTTLLLSFTSGALFVVLMNEAMKNPNISIHTQAGQPLPPQWQQQAKERAQQADKNYLDRLQNAWRPDEQRHYSGNILQDSRLKPPSWGELFGSK